MAVQLEIQKLLENVPEARILMSLPTGEVLEAFLTSNEISLSGGNTWSDGEESALFGKLSSGYGAVTGFMNRFGAGAVQSQVTNIANTMASWVGSNKFAITIPLSFIAVGVGPDEFKNPTLAIQKLTSTTYPVTGSASNWGQKVEAPLGYVHNRASEIEGGISLDIGNWLRVPPILIVDGWDMSVASQRVDVNGSLVPLYATGSVNFRSARLNSAEEVRGFLS